MPGFNWRAAINGLSITFVILLTVEIKCQNLSYEYTVDVPKYKCDKKRNIEAGETTIRLLGKDAQKLKYDWSVNFKSIDNCKHNKQRCTLMAWQAVRDLEKYLRNVGTAKENAEEIKINNTILVPDIQYILKVTAINNGTKVGNKEFILECTNSTETTTGAPGESETVAEQTKASIKLLGTNVTYRDMMYILNAEATDCDNNCSYYFKWEVLDNSENAIISEPTKGSQLQFSSNLLTVTEQYTIRCSLMSPDETTLIATALQSIEVLGRGMVLKLSVSALGVGPRQPFKLFAYFNDADNLNGTTTIEWTCTDASQGKCAGFNTVNATTIESNGLSAVGRYNITITVTKGKATKKDWCEIQVVENGFAKIEVENVDEPIDPSKEIDIPVYISLLITSCMLQWTSVNTTNYEYLDMKSVPGNVNAITNITAREDEFLNEIDEFTNNTVDIEYNLKIPSPRGEWKGLKGDTSYLFRLNVTCPIAQQDSSDEEEEEEAAEPLLMQNSVTLTANVTLHTNIPPSLNALEVTPTHGIALKTLFYFNTSETVDGKADYPMLYKFGYFLKNETIFVSNLLGVTTTKSVLPYIDTGVKTVLEGCNSHSLCAQITGPVVTTEAPLISDKDQGILTSQLTELFNREEYYKAFTYSLAILETFSGIDENVWKNMQGFVLNLTVSDIKRLLVQSNDDNTNWRVPANDLIKNVGLLLSEFSNSEDLLNNVVALRNKLANKKDIKLLVEYVPTFTRRKLLTIDEPKRVKRQSEKISLEEVKSYLIISELIITTSPEKHKVKQEKQNMLNQIDKFMQQLCATLYEKSQVMNLELKTVILSVEKVNKNNYNRYLHILYDANTWKVNGRVKLGKCFTEKIATNQMCLGKVVLKNYLSKKGLVYMVKAYSADANVELQDIICDFVLVLPLDEKQIENKEVKCAFWRKRWLQSQCKTLQVTAKNIQCTCNYLGYYSLEYNTIQAVTTTTATPERVINIDTVETPTEPSLLTSTEIATLDATTGTHITTKSTVATKTGKTTLELLPITDVTIRKLTPATEGPTKDSDGVTETIIIFTTDELSTNATDIESYISEENDETVLYVIIGFSLSGIGVLLYGIRYLLRKREDIPDDNFPKYAFLHHQEMLEDLPD